MKTTTMKTVTLSREQLYDQVWKTPMRTLAKRYGLSDVGLAKICKSHDIPKPPVGYWAKKEVGKAPPQSPLSDALAAENLQSLAADLSRLQQNSGGTVAALRLE